MESTVRQKPFMEREKQTKVFLIGLIALCGCGEELVLDRYGEWLYPPEIEVCSSVNFAEEKILSAAEWWGKLGYPNDGLEFSTYCGDYIGIGVIRIKYDDDLNDKEVNGEGMLAYTDPLYHSWSCDPFGLYPGEGAEFPEFDQMCHATIYLSRSPILEVIKHEFGHAFGWDHPIYGGKCHIMAEEYKPLCTKSSEGLEQ